MGLFKKLKQKSQGVFTEAPPQKGVDPAPAQEVVARLQAVGGQGVTNTTEEDGAIVIAWSAVADITDEDGANMRRTLHRAIRVTVDPESTTARGLCLSSTSESGVGGLSFMKAKHVERGALTGSETVSIVSWDGQGGDLDLGYKFSWSDLRTPILEAVTGAGWTYKPLSK